MNKGVMKSNLSRKIQRNNFKACLYKNKSWCKPIVPLLNVNTISVWKLHLFSVPAISKPFLPFLSKLYNLSLLLRVHLQFQNGPAFDASINISFNANINISKSAELLFWNKGQHPYFFSSNCSQMSQHFEIHWKIQSSKPSEVKIENLWKFTVKGLSLLIFLPQSIQNFENSGQQ